jgi:hypothetical protein
VEFAGAAEGEIMDNDRIVGSGKQIKVAVKLVVGKAAQCSFLSIV